MLFRSFKHAVWSVARYSSDTGVKKRNSLGRLISLKKESVGGPVCALKPSSGDRVPGKLYSVVAACTAESYDFNRLLPFLQKHFQLSPFICDDVLHVQRNSEEIFFFKNGSLVYWSSEASPSPSPSSVSSDPAVVKTLKQSVLPTLKAFEVSPFKTADFEELSYKLVSGSNINTGMEEETIVLNCETVSIKDKLAFSNGLADSVKLGILEGMLDEHIDKVKAIPSALMRNSKIALGRGEMLSLTGELLHFRAQLNLNSDLLDTPDIYWSEPKLEDLYIRISRVLETRRRTAILNKKLDYAKEMAQVLSEHLAEKHGLKLEWGIIALIAVEVAFETFHLIEKFI